MVAVRCCSRQGQAIQQVTQRQEGACQKTCGSPNVRHIAVVFVFSSRRKIWMGHMPAAQEQAVVVAPLQNSPKGST